MWVRAERYKSRTWRADEGKSTVVGRIDTGLSMPLRIDMRLDVQWHLQGGKLSAIASTEAFGRSYLGDRLINQIPEVLKGLGKICARFRATSIAGACLCQKRLRVNHIESRPMGGNRAASRAQLQETPSTILRAIRRDHRLVLAGECIVPLAGFGMATAHWYGSRLYWESEIFGGSRVRLLHPRRGNGSPGVRGKWTRIS